MGGIKQFSIEFDEQEKEEYIELKSMNLGERLANLENELIEKKEEADDENDDILEELEDLRIEINRTIELLERYKELDVKYKNTIE